MLLKMLDIRTFYQIQAGHLKMNIWPGNFDKGERVVNEIIFTVCFDMKCLHLCRLICVLCKIYSGILNPWKSNTPIIKSMMHTLCIYIYIYTSTKHILFVSWFGTAFKNAHTLYNLVYWLNIRKNAKSLQYTKTFS